MRWGGTILLGSALIAAALDYFYRQLDRQTGTSLDQWVHWPEVPDPVWTGGSAPSNAAQIAEAIEAKCGPGLRVYPSIEIHGVHPNYTGFSMYVRHTRWGKVADLGRVSFSSPVSYSQAYAAATSAVWPRFKEWVMSRCPEAFAGRPPLGQWIQQHPDAAQGVRQVVTTYVDATPVGSPRSPYPGVELQPVPNPNPFVCYLIWTLGM